MSSFKSPAVSVRLWDYWGLVKPWVYTALIILILVMASMYIENGFGITYSQDIIVPAP